MVGNVVLFAIALGLHVVLGWGACTLGAQPHVRPIANTSSMGGDLSGFTFPVMGGGQVLFNPTKGDQGVLLVYQGESVTREISHATQIAGSPNTSRITGFGDFSIPHTGDEGIAFTATVSTTQGSIDGVYVAPSGSIPVAVPVATTGGPMVFTSFAYPSVAVSRDGSNLLVTFVASTSTSAAIYVSEFSGATAGKLQKIVATGDTIPGSGGLTFLCLESASIAESGEVAFFGSHCSDSSSSAISAQRAKRAMYRTRHRESHCLHLGRDHVYPGIFRTAVGGKVQVVASAGTSVPGRSEGDTFVAFSSAAMGADGTVAFVAEGPNSLGVYAQAPNGPLRVVADTSSRFSDFPEVPSVGRGHVAFYAGAGSVAGVYIQGKDHSAAQALITTADTAMGQGIIFIGFGQHAYNETSGEIAVYLVLDDEAGTDGIYAVMPPSCEKQNKVGTTA